MLNEYLPYTLGANFPSQYFACLYLDITSLFRTPVQIIAFDLFSFQTLTSVHMETNSHRLFKIDFLDEISKS